MHDEAGIPDKSDSCFEEIESSGQLSAERMRVLLDNSLDILSLMDEQGRLLYNSPAAQRLHGFSREEMAGRPTFEFFHPEDVAEVGRVFQACLEQPGQPVRAQYRYARKDGSWIWMEAVAVNLLQDPAVRAIVVNSRDISERKSHEIELERLNRLHEVLSQLGKSLVHIHSREGLFQEICTLLTLQGGFPLAWVGWVEPRTQQVVPVATAGIARDYLEGISIYADDRAEGCGPTGISIREDRTYICQSFARNPITAPWHERAARHGLRASTSFPIRVGGHPVGALMVYSSEEDAFGEREVAVLEEAAAHLSFGLDHLASEEQRKRLEAGLIQAQKMESLGSLAGGVAHDMNNVLGAILGLASAHLELQAEGTPTYRAFSTIAKAAVRGGEMVQGLLSFARQSAAESHALDLNRIIQEEVQLLEHTTLAKIRLELDLADVLPPVCGDPAALSHALMNLCVNAVDAMPGQGTLTLRTRTVDPCWVEVLVEDTGVGMTPEVAAKALDPFFTTKEVGKGTGLGLSIVYSTMKAHRGQVEIDSEPGRGTRVRLRFPVGDASTSETPLKAHIGAASEARSLKVLLVDDDELIHTAVESALEVLGHQLDVATRGEEALARLEAGLACDVVILDLNMPGMGGAQALPGIRALRPELPVLLATGRIDAKVVALCEAHPHVSLLPKPFALEELRKRLEGIGTL